VRHAGKPTELPSRPGTFPIRAEGFCVVRAGIPTVELNGVNVVGGNRQGQKYKMIIVNKPMRKWRNIPHNLIKQPQANYGTLITKKKDIQNMRD
jgi:hypothetical protein